MSESAAFAGATSRRGFLAGSGAVALSLSLRYAPASAADAGPGALRRVGRRDAPQVDLGPGGPRHATAPTAPATAPSTSTSRTASSGARSSRASTAARRRRARLRSPRLPEGPAPRQVHVRQAADALPHEAGRASAAKASGSGSPGTRRSPRSPTSSSTTPVESGPRLHQLRPGHPDDAQARLVRGALVRFATVSGIVAARDLRRRRRPAHRRAT